MPLENVAWEEMRNCYGFEATPVEFRRQAITDAAAREVCKGCVVRAECTIALKEALASERATTN